MSVVKDIAAIAKGLSITFREMFKPTVVENYPDGKGPLKGAVFQERFRGVHVLQRSEEHTSELQSHLKIVCRPLLEKKNTSKKFTKVAVYGDIGVSEK